MKKTLIISLLVIVGTLALAMLPPVRNLLLGMYMPTIPNDVPVTDTLAENANGMIRFQTYSPYDFDVILSGRYRDTPTAGMGYLSLPDSATPAHRVPAMILLPGSGGITAGREREYAQWLNAKGIAAFIVEYYLPRGATEDYPYVVRTSSTTEFDVITDAYSALRLLQTSPEIDPARIGLMGFSYGGMATRFAMDERFHAVLAPDAPGFALHVDFYGPCFQSLGTTHARQVPLLTLRGTADGSNDLQACVKREDELRALGVSVDTEIFPGAGHAWEKDAPPYTSDSPYIAGCEVTYDKAGFSYLKGERINDVNGTDSRLDRIAARLSSGGKYEGCLHYGYTVGRHEKAMQGAYQRLDEFLQTHFHLPPQG